MNEYLERDLIYMLSASMSEEILALPSTRKNLGPLHRISFLHLSVAREQVQASRIDPPLQHLRDAMNGNDVLASSNVTYVCCRLTDERQMTLFVRLHWTMFLVCTYQRFVICEQCNMSTFYLWFKV